LPEKRPKVVPDDYGDASGNATGSTIGESLFLDNEGEPAYDVAIAPINVGLWHVRFEGLTRLSGKAESRAIITSGNSGVTRLYGPWLEWWQGMGSTQPSPEMDLII